MKKIIYFILSILVLFLVALSIYIVTSVSGKEKIPSKETLKEKYKENDAYHYQEKEGKRFSISKFFKDSIALPPVHLASVAVFSELIDDLQTVSIDVEIKNDIPDNYKFYIAPFSNTINGMNFYAGIQTKSDGLKFPNGNVSRKIGRGAIFSRWYERSNDAIQTNGYFVSSKNEGDFISVRNKFDWGKGRYRIIIFKDKYIPGKIINESINPNELKFSFGEYEHTWVGMKVLDLSTNVETEIGKLAFPGKKLKLSHSNTVFVENYGQMVDYSKNKKRHSVLKFLKRMINFDEVPKIDIVISNYQVNGKSAQFVPMMTKYNGQQAHNQDAIMKLPRTADVKIETDGTKINISTGQIFPFKSESIYYDEVKNKDNSITYKMKY